MVDKLRIQLATVANSSVDNTKYIDNVENQKRIGKDGKKYPAPPSYPPPPEDEPPRGDTMKVKRTLTESKAICHIHDIEENGCCQCEREECPRGQNRIVKFGDAVHCNRTVACGDNCPRLIRNVTQFPPVPIEPEKPKAPPVPVDGIGRPIPSSAMETWARRHDAQEILRKVSDIRSAVKKAQDNHDPLWAEIRLNEMHTQVDNLYAQLKPLVPYTVCPSCQGLAECRLCNGRRMISKFRWDTAVTDIQKKRANDEVEKLSEKRG